MEQNAIPGETSLPAAGTGSEMTSLEPSSVSEYDSLDSLVEHRFFNLLDLFRFHSSKPLPWVDMLQALCHDVDYQDVTYVGLMNAPAAKANHHCHRGGLVAHYLEMFSIFESLRTDIYGVDPMINPQTVLEGIVLHDLHKGWTHFVRDSKAPNGFEYSKHPSSMMLRPDQKTVYIASHWLPPLSIIQLNAVYHSEGGWADSPPKWNTPLSKLLYLLDELSSNVRDRTLGTKYEVGKAVVFGDKGNSTTLDLNMDLPSRTA